MNCRIKLTKNSIHQLFSDNDRSNPTLNTIDNSVESSKRENDVLTMTSTITHNNLLPCNTLEVDRGLVNTFTCQQATLEQKHDLLNCRTIEEQAMKTYIETSNFKKVINFFVATTTITRKKILTMSSSTVKKQKKKSTKERENDKMLRDGWLGAIIMDKNLIQEINSTHYSEKRCVMKTVLHTRVKRVTGQTKYKNGTKQQITKYSAMKHILGLNHNVIVWLWMLCV